MMQVQNTRRMTRRKVFAIVAGAAALGIGVTATLAAWTDTEWVFGGNGSGGAGIGTSSFSVEQNTVAPFGTGTWANEPDNPGGEIVFGLNALDLTPGESVYSQMALRTAPTSVAGDVTLQAAVPAAGIAVVDAGGLLFAGLDVRVATDDIAFTCDGTAFSGAPGAPTIIADGPLDATGGSAAQSLLAAAGSTQFYCFEVTLPDDIDPPQDYMGRTAAPAWEFTAES